MTTQTPDEGVTFTFETSAEAEVIKANPEEND